MPEVLDPQLPEVDPPGFDTNEDLLTKGGYTDPEENPYNPPPPEQDENSFGEIRKRVTQRRQEIQDRFFKKKPPSTPEAPPVEKPPTTKLSEPNTSSSSINAQHRIDLGKPGAKTAKELEEQAAKSSLKGVERKAITSTGTKIATHSAEEIGKTAAKSAAKQVGKKVAGAAIRRVGLAAVSAGVGLLIDLAITGLVYIVKKGWRYILVGIAIILLLPALIFALQGGQTAKQTVSTEGQRQQITLISSLAGDKIAKNENVNTYIAGEKDRYRIVMTEVNSDPTVSGRSAEINQKLTLYYQKLNEIIAASSVTDKHKLLLEADQQYRQAIDDTLPFGKWLAQYALNQVDQGSEKFCQVTGAPERKGCATFVSVALTKVGIPGSAVKTTTSVWINPALRMIIERHDTLSNSYLDLNKLHPGDFVWFGNGVEAQANGNGGRNPLFEHVGIYIGNPEAIVGQGKARCKSGNDKIVDNGGIGAKKDQQGKIFCRSIRAHTTKERTLKFNGAKRYGKD